MSRKGLVLVIAFSLLISMVYGAPENQTVSITDTEDDGFITESNNIVDYLDWVYVTSPSQDLWSFWVFDDIHINRGEPLQNATLRLRSGPTVPFDADNSFTLYGIELTKLQDSWRPLAGMIKNFPLTSASVNVNSSQMYGNQYHDINVTSIVSELIAHSQWEGDIAFGPGDSIGFLGLATSDNSRSFYDYNGSVAYSADLIIHWGADPDPPPSHPDAEFNETYQEIEIFEIDEEDFAGDNSSEPGDGAPVNNTYPWDLDLRGNWVNTSWVEVDPNNRMTFANESHIELFNWNGLDPDTSFRRLNFTQFESAIILLHLNMTAVDPAGAGAPNYPGSIIIGESDSIHTQTAWENVHLTFLFNWADNTQWKFRLKETGDGNQQFFGSMTDYETENTRDLWIIFWASDYTNRAGYAVYNSSELTSSNLVFNQTVSLIYANEGNWDTIAVMKNAELGSGRGIIQDGDLWFPVAPRGGQGGFIIDDPSGNCTNPGTFETLEDAQAWIDSCRGADPEDPDPPGQDWYETGPFTRFGTRLYILMLGLIMVIAPMFYFSWKAQTDLNMYMVVIGLYIMLIGLGLMLYIRQI